MLIAKSKLAPSKLQTIWLLMLASYVLTYVYLDKHIFDSLQLTRHHMVLSYNRWNRIGDEDDFHYDRSKYYGLPMRESDKVVLIWEPPFANTRVQIHSTQDCRITYDKSVAPIADLIVFHCTETPDARLLLPSHTRPSNQRWVWWCMEPPGNTRYVFQKTLTPLNGLFNWTYTYRLDSDMLASYATYHQPTDQHVKDIIKKKTADRLVAWVVSNCAASFRADYADRINKIVPIEYYGRCSHHDLPHDIMNAELSKFKFYLAFENSKCKDYITEKFWNNALGSGCVPVVMGPPRSDYEKVTPPDSFIHVDDFDSPEHLAEYLIELDQDDEKYGRYLRWRSIPDSGGNWIDGLKTRAEARRNEDPGLARAMHEVGRNYHARFCQRLRDADEAKEVKTIEKLDEWWYGPGYTDRSKSFPVCDCHTGPSGYPLGWVVTLLYSILYVLLTVYLSFKCSSRPFSIKTDRGGSYKRIS